MGFLFKKKQAKVNIEIKGYENGKEVKLKKGKKEEAKSFSYYEIIEKEIKPLENVLVGFSSALKTIKDEQDRIDVLTALVESFYVLKDKCSSLGKDYEEYFSKTWEHCHSSKNSDFNFVKRFEVELKELNEKKENTYARF